MGKNKRGGKGRRADHWSLEQEDRDNSFVDPPLTPTDLIELNVEPDQDPAKMTLETTARWANTETTMRDGQTEIIDRNEPNTNEEGWFDQPPKENPKMKNFLNLLYAACGGAILMALMMLASLVLDITKAQSVLWIGPLSVFGGILCLPLIGAFMTMVSQLLVKIIEFCEQKWRLVASSFVAGLSLWAGWSNMSTGYPTPSSALNFVVGLVSVVCFGGLTIAMGVLGKNSIAKLRAETRGAYEAYLDTARNRDRSLAGPKAALYLLSAIVSTLMMMTMWPTSEGNIVSKGLALAVGCALGAVYLIIEGRAMVVLATPGTPAKDARRMALWAASVAFLSVPLSFGKVYSLASYNARVAESRQEVETKAKEFLSLVEPGMKSRIDYAETEQQAAAVKASLNVMKTAVDSISKAHSYEEVEAAANEFVKAGSGAPLPKGTSPQVLSSVMGPTEPSHLELFAQVITGKQLPGAKEVQWGAAIFALSATFFVDFAAVILSLVLRASVRKREEDPKEEANA